jgi:hypothetical protein
LRCRDDVAAREKSRSARAGRQADAAGWVVNEDGSMATDSAQILQDLKDKKAALLTGSGAGRL